MRKRSFCYKISSIFQIKKLFNLISHTRPSDFNIHKVSKDIINFLKFCLLTETICLNFVLIGMKYKWIIIAAVAVAAITCSSSFAEENTQSPTPAATTLTEDTIAEVRPVAEQLTSQILAYAGSLIGKPYSWGATGPRAYDCSGFTRHVFNNFGLELNRSSRDQFTQGIAVEPDDIQPGDLLFFGGRANSKLVGHVGIATEIDNDGSVHFIHSASSQGVRYDNLQESDYFKKRFIGARRVLQ